LVNENKMKTDEEEGVWGKRIRRSCQRKAAEEVTSIISAPRWAVEGQLESVGARAIDRNYHLICMRRQSGRDWVK